MDDIAIETAARKLIENGRAALILGGQALKKEGLLAAARIKTVTHCELYVETFPARMDRGIGIPAVKRIPYFPEQAISELSQYQTVIIAGAKEPVAFFGWPDSPGRFLNENQHVFHISNDQMNTIASLEGLANAVDAPVTFEARETAVEDQTDQTFLGGQLTGDMASMILSQLQPENAIIVDESITSGATYFQHSERSRPHTLLCLTGGAIGQGIPCAVGAAIACPHRQVINFQADGSAMYTVQALWMQARESLNITTLICSNRSYDILKFEMARAGYTTPGENAAAMTTIDNPVIDWVKISTGMGVPAVAVDTGEELAKEINRSFAVPGPYLIELKL